MVPVPAHTSSDFSIGSIVTLHVHPFYESKDREIVIISGDSLYTPPLMIIVETLQENKTLYDENSGMELTRPGSFQCKCLWYSSKTGHFEEAWLPSRLLKVIEASKAAEEIKNFSYGSLVHLITAPIEISKKRKPNKQPASHFVDDKGINVEGHFSFVGPVLQVIGTAKSESKEPLFDSKTGERKRWISNRLIKCKYYNPISEKFSDTLIPNEALALVNFTNKERLDFLYEIISKKQCLIAPTANKLLTKTIIKPQRINYKLGNYYLEGKDYLENRTIEILIENGKDQFVPLSEKFHHLPRFEETEKRLKILPINKDNLKTIPADKFWRIKYKDSNGNITTRTIFNPDFYYGKDLQENENKDLDYLKANCILRDHETRYFRLDRIQKLEVLDLLVADTIVNPLQSNDTNAPQLDERA